MDSALRARAGLNNADVYAGCCTLKIEFSRTEKLNIRRNNEDTYDYTDPSLGQPRSYPPQQPPTYKPHLCQCFSAFFFLPFFFSLVSHSYLFTVIQAWEKSVVT